ncbi:MAG: flagellar hook-basal body complex protein FliE [Symbiobacteriaceae bacterium]|nr:flagellar hook-basal body complex protein FliE [Symbiobacteriaceae bacterium]
MDSISSLTSLNNLSRTAYANSQRTAALTPLEESWQRRLLGEATPAAESLNFSGMLQTALAEVQQAQKVSDQMTVAMLLGAADIHEATIAMEKATLTLRTFIQVRDKMLEAYQEIMRMQV